MVMHILNTLRDCEASLAVGTLWPWFSQLRLPGKAFVSSLFSKMNFSGYPFWLAGIFLCHHSHWVLVSLASCTLDGDPLISPLPIYEMCHFFLAVFKNLSSSLQLWLPYLAWFSGFFFFHLLWEWLWIDLIVTLLPKAGKFEPWFL